MTKCQIICCDNGYCLWSVKRLDYENVFELVVMILKKNILN